MILKRSYILLLVYFIFCPTLLFLVPVLRTFEIAFSSVIDRDLRLKDTLLPKHPRKGNAIAPVY